MRSICNNSVATLLLLFGISTIANAEILIETFQSTISVNSLAVADSAIAGNNISSSAQALSTVVDHYDGSGDTGHFPNNFAFPGGMDTNFALRASGFVHIPTSGTWTFGTNNDDGVRLRVNNSNVITDDSLHPTLDFFGTITLAAGYYPMELVFFEAGGGASIELFATTGTASSFDASFRLVGDTANGGLEVVQEVPPPTQAAAVPVDNPWALLALSALLLGFARKARRFL